MRAEGRRNKSWRDAREFGIGRGGTPGQRVQRHEHNSLIVSYFWLNKRRTYRPIEHARQQLGQTIFGLLGCYYCFRLFKYDDADDDED